MRLYSGPVRDFIDDVLNNRIGEKLSRVFEDYYGHRVGYSELTSWNNSLRFLKDVIGENQLFDNAIAIEYELPYSTKRIDAILFGKNNFGISNVVILELKQWSRVEDSEIEDNIVTFTGGANRMEPHPSLQVRGYHFLLSDFLKLFQEKDTALYSCVYCHNYQREEGAILFEKKFDHLTKDFPIFGKNDFREIGDYLKKRLSNGGGLEILNRFINSPIGPSKKLLEHTRSTIDGNPAFNLVDEQITAYNAIVDRIKKVAKLKKKTVIIVRGGPGTGKSVIALNALAEVLSKGQKVYHATGSAAFTSTLRRLVGVRAAAFFKYFNSFTKAKENEIDVLIMDEAHRIRKTSNSRYTKKTERSDTPQIEELLKVAKICVFFIDDFQAVRPDEIGSSGLIIESAKKFDSDLYDFELKTQFRCSGSDGYLNWVDDILNIRYTANHILSSNEKMDFRIFDSPHILYEAIKYKNLEKPNSARMVAGFCWPWSNTKSDGTLVEDVVIDDFKMTWEAKNDTRKIASGVVRANDWARDPNGVDQMGSIYTIQGFEFDYVGVIFGKDLIYDSEKKMWIGQKSESCDSKVKRESKTEEEFTKYIKNVYRVLLTRGMKGCYMYFLDKETERFFRSRIEAK
ncbi:MAG: DUF2075 domain-containing protein [Candidatus Paceibacterota bacterium]|jgi:hypothetical protein